MAESISIQVTRKLCDLRVIDLKNELELRSLDKNGIKQALYERLKKALMDSGNDPDTFVFEIPTSTLPTKPKKSESLSQEVDLTCEDGDSTMNNQITIGFEEDYSDLLQSRSLEELNSVSSTLRAVSDVTVPQEGLLKEESLVVSTEEATDKKVHSSSQSSIDKPSQPTQSTNLAISDTLIIDEAPQSASKTTTSTQASLTDHNVISIHASTLHEPLEAPVQVEQPAATKLQCTSAVACKQDVPAKNPQGDGAKEGPKDKSLTPGLVEAKKAAVKTVSSGHNLWVSGLSVTTRAADLKNLFSKHGKVTGAKVVTNAKSPGSKCYGFVTMSSHEEAGRCIKNLNRNELHGKIISVERAKADPSVNSALNKKAIVKARPTAATKTTAAAADVSKAVGDKKVEGGKGDGKKEDAVKKNGVGKGDGGKGDGVKKDVRKRYEGKKPFRPAREHPRGNFNNNNFRRNGPPPGMRYNPFMNRRRDTTILTLEKIREARDREQQREMDRVARQEERRQHMMLMREKDRQREVERLQREEAGRLAMEKEKLRLEKQKLELDRIATEREKVSLEREKQRRERDKLERERDERKKELLRHMDERKVVKRSGETSQWEENKRKVVPTPAYHPRSYGGHGNNSHSNIGNNSHSNIGSNIGSNIRSNIGSNIRSNISSNIGSNRRGSPEKKHFDNKSRHLVQPRGAQREDSKTRKQEDRSRVEWRSVSKNEPSSSSLHHRSSRGNLMQTTSDYHYPPTWSSNTKAQAPSSSSWTPSYPTPFATPINYLAPPPTTMPTFNSSRVTSGRYEPYKNPRRY